MPASAKFRLNRSDVAGPDVVSAIVSEVRITSASVSRFEFRSPWGLTMHGPPYILAVSSGLCRVRSPDGLVAVLEPGDFLVSLRGTRVDFSDSSPVYEQLDIADLWRISGAPEPNAIGYRQVIRICSGGSGAETLMSGAALTYAPGAARSRAVRSGPDPLIIRASQKSGVDLLNLLIDHELASPSDGFAAACMAPVQHILSYALRSYLNGEGVSLRQAIEQGSSGFPQLIREIQLDPSKGWSVAKMAFRANMSRTRFFQHFQQLTGQTPSDYVLSRRMGTAAQLLSEGNRSVAEIASVCGYASERAFRKAFTKVYGSSPRDFRAQQRQRASQIYRASE